MTVRDLKQLLAAIPDEFNSVPIMVAVGQHSRFLYQIRVIPDHNPDGEAARVILVPWRAGAVRPGNQFLPPAGDQDGDQDGGGGRAK